jgi:hypothetical protein
MQPALPVLARAILPEAAAFTAADWQAMTAIIDEALAARPRATRRQLGLFIALLRTAAVLRFGRRLERLGEQEARALLAMFERAPLLAVRRGVWGLRTLVFMGYYTRDEAAWAIGYRATAAGWQARR